MNSKQARNQAANNEHPCIWMQAGVVPKKFCWIDFQCAACAYDRAMQRVASENLHLKENGKIPRRKAWTHCFLEGQITGVAGMETALFASYDRPH
jgi:hypothetical protein